MGDFEVIENSVENFKRAFSDEIWSSEEIKNFADKVAAEYQTSYQLIKLKSSNRYTVAFGTEGITPETGYKMPINGSNAVITARVNISIPESEKLGISELTSVETAYTITTTRGVRDKDYKIAPDELKQIAKSKLIKIGRPGLIGGSAVEGELNPAQTVNNEAGEELTGVGEREDTGMSEEDLMELAEQYIPVQDSSARDLAAMYIDYQQKKGLLLAHTQEIEVNGAQFANHINRQAEVDKLNADFLSGRMPIAEWKAKSGDETLNIQIADVTQDVNTAHVTTLMKKALPNVTIPKLSKIYLEGAETPTYPHEEHALVEAREKLSEQVKEKDAPITVGEISIMPNDVRSYVNDHLQLLNSQGKIQQAEKGIDIKLDERDLSVIAGAARERQAIDKLDINQNQSGRTAAS